MLEKTFNPKDIEEKHYQDWEGSGAFAAHPESNKAPFTIMMPPPNVTGSLHMGHALTMTLQDVMTRYQRMNDKDMLWMPGTDHAGIATQMVVERQLGEQGLDRRDMGREKFLEKVWQWKEESGGTIVRQLRRLGATPDWPRERFTMDEGLSRAVLKVFVDLYKEGLIYRDKRLVNWDPKFHTAISDLEVENRDVKGHMWHIQYAVEGDEARTITVATTRPETMLGDTAIAVHPDDERYKDLVGKNAILPIVGRLIPIVADDYADPEQGSGAVKITPAHDFNDFEVGKRHDLLMINIFDIDAKLNENVPEAYRGMDRFEARKKIHNELEELDILEKEEKIAHTVPYGDRSGVVIEPFLTDQWYVDAHTLAQPALEAVRSGKTEFVPKNWENTYFDWLENIQPWCISRQLWWGHQIPAWYDEQGKVYVAESEEEAQKQAGAGVTLTRDEDVLDTWFSSALWPFSTLGWPEKTPELQKYYPGDVLITGFDIIFFWVARMMMMGMHFMDGEVPFKKVYIHALVRDAKGQKMSKSKGNVMDPLDLIDEYGADALRFTLMAMAAQGRDVKMSTERVEGYRNFATKLWNAARYCEMNEALPRDGFDPLGVQAPLNKWIIQNVSDTKETIDKAMQGYRYNEAAGAIYQFVWGTFCDWYLEFTKPFLKSGDDTLQEEIKGTTGWVLDQILLLLNPFMPYITEELFVQIAKRESGQLLMEKQWPDYSSLEKNEEAVQDIDWLQRMISEIRSLRADLNVPASARIDLLVLEASDQTKTNLETYKPALEQMARLSAIATEGEAKKGAVKSVIDEATIVLPVADLIDLDKERARLQKQIEKLEQEISTIDQRLSNEKFVSNAPEEVVTEQKERKAEAQGVRDKLATALEQIKAA